MAKACFSCDAFNGPSATRPQLRRHHRRHPQCRSMSSTSGSSGWRWCYIVSRYTVRLLFICDLSSSSAAAGARTAAVATRRVVERGWEGWWCPCVVLMAFSFYSQYVFVYLAVRERLLNCHVVAVVISILLPGYPSSPQLFRGTEQSLIVCCT